MLSALAVVAVGLLALIVGVASAAAAPGTFVEPLSSPEDVGADRPNEVASADFDGDGDLDAALADRGGDAVKIATNDGTGDMTLKQSVGVGDFPTGIVAANLDSDTDTDLAVINRSDRTVQVLINDGSGSFAAKTAVPSGAAIVVDNTAIDAGDLVTGNGNDLAIIADNDPQILVNDGAGNFTLGASLGPASTTESDLVIAPLDGNATPDLAVTETGNSGSPGRVGFYLSNGDGTFAAGGFYDTNRASVNIVASAAGGFDGNASGSGAQARDLAVLNSFASGADQASVTVLLNDGDGTATFTEPSTSPTVLNNDALGEDLVRGDFAGSGGADDLAIPQGPAGVGILLNTGSGGFTEPAGSPFDPTEFVTYNGLASADVDADGDDDLFTANDDPGPGDLSVLLNDEDGDGDGVADRDDACPGTSGSEANGCNPGQEPDADGDGVPDSADACPNQSGSGQNGCPPGTGPDSDGDGVPAGDDACPNQSSAGGSNIDGQNGCPTGLGPDGDGDGVPAGDDFCPSQAQGSGLNGCPPGTGPDGDNDGVPAGSDACPSQAGSQANGCPPSTGPGNGAPGDILDFDVTAKKKQKQKGKKIKVKVSVGAGEKVDVKGKGSIKIKGTKGKLKLKPQSKTVEGGERTVLRLQLKKKKDAKKVKKAIKRYKEAPRKKKKKIAVKARIVVNGTAVADGDQAKEKRVVTLK